MAGPLPSSLPCLSPASLNIKASVRCQKFPLRFLKFPLRFLQPKRIVVASCAMPELPQLSPRFRPAVPGLASLAFPVGLYPPCNCSWQRQKEFFLGRCRWDKAALRSSWFSYSRVPDLVFPGQEQGLQLSAISSRKDFRARGAAGHPHELQGTACAPVVVSPRHGPGLVS